MFKHTNNFGSFFQTIWVIELTRPDSQNTSAFFFPFHYIFYLSNFSFDTPKLTFIHECSHVMLPVQPCYHVTSVAMLSCYQCSHVIMLSV